jgi:cell wall-associated NlpC family hydrolase
MTLSRYSLAGAITGCVALALVAVFALGVGVGGSHHAAAAAKTSPGLVGKSHPAPAHAATTQAVKTQAAKTQALPATKIPIVPSGPASATGGVQPSGAGATPKVSVGAEGQAVATEAPDPEAAKSFPVPAATAVRHHAATTPSAAGENAAVAAGAPSDAEVRKELSQMHAVERAAQHQTLAPVPGGESIGGSGALTPPPGIPAVIARVIAGANAIADFPYVFGGGHASFVDNAYDCSGSVSYALAAGGLLSVPETSGQLESWGAPGPGRWITVYANAGHTYMYVDGILFDTAGRSGPYASRWQVGGTDNEGYVVRHYPGL